MAVHLCVRSVANYGRLMVAYATRVGGIACPGEEIRPCSETYRAGNSTSKRDLVYVRAVYLSDVFLDDSSFGAHV